MASPETHSKPPAQVLGLPRGLRNLSPQDLFKPPPHL